MRDLTDKEVAVVQAMRASPRARDAIHNYATSFAGDDQAVTTEQMADDYETAYDGSGSD